MFEDSLFASTARRSRQRGMAATLSFAVQAVGIGILVLVPLIYTDALPLRALAGYVELPMAPTRSAQPAPEPKPTPHTDSNIENGRIVEPHIIPRGVGHIVDTHTTEQGGSGTGPDIPGAIPGDGVDDGRNTFANLLPILPKPEVPRSIAPPKTVPLSSGITEGLLIHKITPIYPHLARQSHTQGAVVLHAFIGRDGTIENLQVVSGHPLLVAAAIDAVKQWRYRPYLLNNQPVEVETQIIVIFTLNK